jgi:hypothetical protein
VGLVRLERAARGKTRLADHDRRSGWVRARSAKASATTETTTQWRRSAQRRRRLTVRREVHALVRKLATVTAARHALECRSRLLAAFADDGQRPQRQNHEGDRRIISHEERCHRAARR